MRQGEDRWIDNSRGAFWDVSPLWSNIHLCFGKRQTLEHWWDTQRVDGPGHEVRWCWLKGSRAVGTWLLIYEVHQAPWRAVLEGGRVFVRTYLSLIYHAVTPPPTFCCTLTCELVTKNGSDEVDAIAGKCARGQLHCGWWRHRLWLILLLNAFSDTMRLELRTLQQKIIMAWCKKLKIMGNGVMEPLSHYDWMGLKD